MEVKVISEVDVELVKKLTLLEEEAFGRGGLNEWTLPVFIRYGKVYILEKEGRIDGIAEFIRDWNDAGVVFLVGFSIHKTKRGKGLGKFFLTQILKLLERENVRAIKAAVSSSNEVALKLYEKLGFVKSGVLKDEYGPEEDRLLLELNLRRDLSFNER